jgi:histone demethylase JARID1
VRLYHGTSSGWKPAFDATAGGEGVPFETKLQTINRLQEGLHFSDGARYDRDSYTKMADAFAAAYDAKHPEFAARAERAKRGAAGPLGAESADPADTAADQRNGDADARLEAEARVVQEEFWRVVETDVESVRVEYGSDLDADVYGTGFAATVPPIGDPEPPSHHAWDFNELIHHPSNLLRVVGSDVPGLTRPWLYFGMLFSAFCWHVEDHYLGSVNYLHAGAPKTWYGIPSASADAFEDAVRVMVPGLLDAAPDLLHRLVTLVPPAALRDGHGVEVFQLLQKPGEFVVTWPRAYHAGFSHGHNVGEAVNFGTAEWVTAGRSAVEGYARGVGKRDAVFSHDRMVMDTARDFARRLRESGESGGVVFAPWIRAVANTLRDELAVILREQEEGQRMLRTRGVRVERVEGTDAAVVDDEVCCASCKSMPHLATVRCTRCWNENEKLEVQKAIARARAEGKSVAGAAFAMLGGGRKAPPGGAGGPSQRYRARRDRARPVFCLRHGMEGCAHAPACRVLEVKQDVDAIKAVMEGLR